MTPAQRHAYVDAHMTVQQHIAQANAHYQHVVASSHRQQIIKEVEHQQTGASTSSHQQYISNIKIPQITATTSATTSSTYTTVPDDGLGYDNGIRVLQSIGSWGAADLPPNIPRPNLIPFTEPYVEGGSLNPNSRLLNHIKPVTHTSSSSSRKSRSSNTSSAPKAFECSVCGKGLARKVASGLNRT